MTAKGKIALFLGGTLFGTAGLKILGSKDAKKAYTHTVAAVLRCKDEVMRRVEIIQENSSDILADAKDINQRRAAADQQAWIDDADPAEAEG